MPVSATARRDVGRPRSTVDGPRRSRRPTDKASRRTTSRPGVSCMACQALVQRFITIWWTCGGVGEDGRESGATVVTSESMAWESSRAGAERFGHDHGRAAVGIACLLLPSAEGQDLPNQLGGPRPALRDRLEVLEHGVVVADVHLRQLGVAADRRQDVVEVVRDAPGQRADGLHLLGLAQLLLHGVPIGLRQQGRDEVAGGRHERLFIRCPVPGWPRHGRSTARRRSCPARRWARRESR